LETLPYGGWERNLYRSLDQADRPSGNTLSCKCSRLHLRQIPEEFAFGSQTVAFSCVLRPNFYHLRPFATAAGRFGAWRSLVAHVLWEEGSNPAKLSKNSN
jgi:hypothetical protein